MTDSQTKRYLENLNCIIIDDDKFARNFTKTTLNQIGIKNIKEAANAIDGEELIRSSRVDIIFTDQQMPEKTGLEMIEDLLKIDPEFTQKIPVIMITSDTREVTVLKAKELNIREYIIKPLSSGILKKRVFNILNLPESNLRD